MRVLALEAYDGGSHRAFLDGWRSRSRHDWAVLSLPPNKWKWRMRHAAVTFADEVADRVRGGEWWDVAFASDMLNLAEFLGLAPEPVRRLPAVAYFHENQLTYPVRRESERDYHFALTNMTTALAATRVWFNSAFHRDDFLGALPVLLKRMPDHQPFGAMDRIRAKSEIRPPGIEPIAPRGERGPGPLRILWAARWEHDKNPETFFEAIRLLRDGGADFRISVIGEQFRERPEVFDAARGAFRDRIDRWGYQPTRSAYLEVLREADVIVSTADHEFFGISMVEAMAAGAWPLLPRRLSYPELLAGMDHPERHLYDGGARELAERLAALAGRRDGHDLWEGAADAGIRAAGRFAWDALAPRYDQALEETAS